jgi:hypothetical protein
VTINLCTESQLRDIVDGNTTRSAILTAVRALTAFTQPTSTLNIVNGTNDVQTCVIAIDVPAANRSLASVVIQVLSTGK